MSDRTKVFSSLTLSIASGFLLALPFPTVNFWPLAWPAFIPLFSSLKGKSWKERFWLGFLCGAFFFSLTISWLTNVTFFGTVLLVLYLSAYFGIFALLSNSGGTTPRFIYLPCLWVALEYSRSTFLTGFGWALLGYSQSLNLPMIQIADIFGVWGVSFLVMMANVVLWETFFLKFGSKPAKHSGIFICVLAVSAVYGYGIIRIHEPENGSKVKVAVIQPNIAQNLKWENELKEGIFKRHYDLSLGVLQEKPDIIIWPEAAMTEYMDALKPLEEQRFYREILAFTGDTDTPLLFGAVVESPDRYFNSAILAEKGRFKERYDKMHLVPFGEYIPLRKYFPFLETVAPIGDISGGNKLVVFTIPGKSGSAANFSVLICFEDTIPGLARGFTRNGADFLVNITNDAWFGSSASPYQHIQASVFRAVENRRALVRSANTGVSAFIGSRGRIFKAVGGAAGKIFVEGAETGDIILSSTQSVYTRIGDKFVYMCFGVVLFGLMRRGLRFTKTIRNLC